MWNQALAIVWAQWKTLRNYLPHASMAGLIFSVLISLGWYGGFTFLSVIVGSVVANPDDLADTARLLPNALLIAFLYWQLIPILMISMGSSLDLKKLLVYPIPPGQLFGIEVLLRVTTGLEVLIVLAGVGIGLLLNPRIPFWAPAWLLPFIFLNLFVSAGLRDLLGRLLARRRIRELLVFLLVMVAALPQLLLRTGTPNRLKQFFSGEPTAFLPWTAAANLVQGRFTMERAAILLGWTAAAYLFGRWQFDRGLRFDAEEASAAVEGATATGGARRDRLERFYRLPGMLFRDPLGAIVEKEVRTLIRSPRFRLVFIMGFSFGLLIWLPMTVARTTSPDSFMTKNFLTFVSLYALLLLSDTLFWNTFGFDRGAAQVYFLFPVKMSTVLAGKNLAAVLFVLLEIVIIALVCTLLRLPVSMVKVIEALAVTVVAGLLLLSIGNLSSLYNPRPVNPAKSFRSAASGRQQAIMMLVFPLALGPVALAYAARYAFDREAAFFGVLALAMIAGWLIYRIAMESAVKLAEERKERIITKLSRGEGPIES